MPLFRELAPSRTCTTSYKNYRSYKKSLILDYNSRCGYCHSSHTWYGGHKHFHVDHFAPKDKFDHLETDYSNLVYACPACNLAKSNKWPSLDATVNIVNDEGFIDPCNEDYNNHFERDGNGFIKGTSAVAKYMVRTLFLNLERHAVTWQLSRLQTMIEDYKNVISSQALSDEETENAKAAHYYLLTIFFDYVQRLDKLNK